MSEISFKNWQVELLRVTAFHGQVPDEQKKNWSSWWTDLVGVPPENTTLRKRDEIFQETGPFNGGQLILTLHPGRVDWHLSTADEEEDTSDGLFLLKSEAVTKFYDLAVRWLKLGSCPPITRLALGCVLLQPVDNRQAGYLKLSEYLSDVKLSPQSSDFSYQINRPRESQAGVEGLKINRLCKWSVALKGKLSLSLSLGPQDKDLFADTVFHEKGRQSACRVEMDINTSPEYKGELPNNVLIRVFDEFVDLAREIAEKGDTP